MSKRRLSRAFLFFILFSLSNVGIQHFDEAAALSATQGKAVSITSEKMVLQNLKHKIIFEGKVTIINADLVIESERAEVFLDPSGSASSILPGGDNQQQVTKIIASGNVRIKKGKQRAKAEKGIYERGKEIVTLTGHPEVWEDGYQVKGSVITIYLNEERTQVAESEVLIHESKRRPSLPKK